MHARRTARDALFPQGEDDRFFAPRRGDIVLRDGAAMRSFADRVNRREGRTSSAELRPAELAAMTLIHDVLHSVIDVYRRRHPESFQRFTAALVSRLGTDERNVVLDFLGGFPPPAVYRTLKGEGDNTPPVYLDRMSEHPSLRRDAKLELDEELILLWVTNQNPAYEPVRTIVGDHELGPRYKAFVEETRRFFANEPRFGPRGETLVDLLLAPGRAHPTSIFAQLDYIDRAWTEPLGLVGLDALGFDRRMAQMQDLRTEEGKWFQKGGPGPGEPLLEAMRFTRRPDDEPARFSPDLNWMPNVVLIAKSVYVWLDQLSKKYERHIWRLDQIPDEELELLASRGLNGLWLIGLFERSPASQKIKQMHGDRDALASAYSLKGYQISRELGGVPAYENLKARASARGVRLAADMVPNHVGIDGDWVIDHPDWFLQARTPPFPAYRFGGPDLADDPRVNVHIEEGYWSRTDAAVVFRRHDNRTGDDRFIYHGNDGTSMPWNDTAQLDYLNPAVRRAVIETILHVARMFPIIRFDAAMTLAKRHIQRLWFPLPGQGGAIPSRADYAMTQEEFDKAIPNEFWREVVDAVASQSPDTLLLAEAFWMMEGYFVRTLGMHRVYNSAFMNMLKREENEKYRETIKNVLDFDPEILKRFVNFMNNPDEDTAIAQFGDNQKYFGVCVLMSTMPGLPMFGHGQIEGLREKYGMEYRRARSGEQPNERLIHRHEREIFPILHKRYLFSGVENFALYDFVTDGGFVDEDVYAYSNGAGGERALVVFNNKWKTTRGRIFASTHRGNVVEELNLGALLARERENEWLILRDLPHGLEYLRRAHDILEGGFAWELDGFAYHVLSGFHPVTATHEQPYDRLAAELGGRGVPDVEAAVRELYLRPIHAPLREASSKGHIEYLTTQLDAAVDTEARAALEERLGHVADGLDWMLSLREDREVRIDRDAVLREASDRFAELYAVVRAARSIEALLAAPEPSEPALSEPSELMAVGEAPTEPELPAAEPATEAEGTTTTIAEPPEVERVAATPETLEVTKPEEAEAKPAGDVPASTESITESAESSPAAAAESSPAAPAEVALAETLLADPPDPTAAEESAVDVDVPGDGAGDVSVLHVDLLLALIHVEAVLELLDRAEVAASAARARTSSRPRDPRTPPPPSTFARRPANAPPTLTAPTKRAVWHGGAPSVSPAVWAEREALLSTWELVTPLVDGFSTIVEPHEARRRTAIVLLAATLPTGPLASAVRLALGTERGQTFMDVHEADGTLWLNKERFEELARFLAEREASSGRITSADAAAEAAALATIAEQEGYRAERIATKLGPAPVYDGRT